MFDCAIPGVPVASVSRAHVQLIPAIIFDRVLQRSCNLIRTDDRNFMVLHSQPLDQRRFD